MSFKRSFLITLLAMLLLSASFIAGVWVHMQLVQEPSFDILREAYHVLINNGLTEAPPAPALEYGMIRGMLQAYGEPNTIFLEPAQHELDSNRLEGKYGGVGAKIQKDVEGFWILYPYHDSPASEAGITDGDRLYGVDYLSISPDTTNDTIEAALRGPVGGEVILNIGKPPDYLPTEISIVREEIQIPSVTWRLALDEPRVGIIDVDLIAASTVDEIQSAVDDLMNQSATHYVLDLRDNPGGILTAGVEIARLFLDDGMIMKQEYRNQDIETYLVEHPGPLKDLPLVIFINHGSASAAEIAAGAIQYHKRAILIGTPTFGKNTIQLVFELRDRSSLRVTAARWWIPGLEPSISVGGLQPDLLVTESDDLSRENQYLLAAINSFFGSN